MVEQRNSTSYVLKTDLFNKAKRSGSSLIHEHFFRARNKVVAKFWKAKADYFQNLKPTIAKHFWKAVNCLKMNSSSIPVLHTQ